MSNLPAPPALLWQATALQKAFAIAGISWNEVCVIQKTAAALSLLLALAACDKTRDTARHGSDQDASPGKTRVDRPSRDVPGTRDKLRDAFEAAKILESGEERDKALAEVAWQALEPAPDLAAQAIAELAPGSEAKQALIEAYLRVLLQDETADKATAWADSFHDEQDRAFARASLASLLADTKPEQALALLPSSGFSAAGVDPAAEQVLQTWVAEDPAAAAAWATRLPAGEARGAGYQVVFSHWINADAQGAFAWAAAQPNQQVRHEAVSAMVGAFNQIPDPVRDDLLQSAAPELRAEIEQGIAEILRQSQDAVPEPVE